MPISLIRFGKKVFSLHICLQYRTSESFMWSLGWSLLVPYTTLSNQFYGSVSRVLKAGLTNRRQARQRVTDSGPSVVWLLTAPGNTGPHRAGSDWLFHFDDELKGVIRANYPQLTKEMNPSRWLWWLGDGRIQCSCLFSWSPSTLGSLLRLNSTHNSRQSEIISHFQPSAGPVQSGVGSVQSGAVRCSL